LTTPAGFAHIEVLQIVDVGDPAVLVFSCHERISKRRERP
jgi:hypothetical protein